MRRLFLVPGTKPAEKRGLTPSEPGASESVRKGQPASCEAEASVPGDWMRPPVGVVPQTMTGFSQKAQGTKEDGESWLKQIVD